MIGEATATMKLSGDLLEEGIFIQGIRPPTVPTGYCRLRCTVTSVHNPDDLEFAAGKVISAWKKLGRP